MKIGLIGLGNMGLALALNMQDKGHNVVSWNRSEDKRENARRQGLGNVKDTLNEVISELADQERKVIWLMISAGQAIDELLFEGEGSLVNVLPAGSIVIEGSNSQYKDSARRAERLASEFSITMLDCGVSGGISGARNGGCYMVGGSKDSFNSVEEIFRTTSKEGGYGYFGSSGAGHYVKMVHNAIEYGMMQAIGEGINLIDHSGYEVDVAKLVEVWRNGSIISGTLMDSLSTALENDPLMSDIEPEIGSLGTGEWAVEEAQAKNVPFVSITNAVATRGHRAEDNQILYKVIQAMRMVFGGHSSSDRP